MRDAGWGGLQPALPPAPFAPAPTESSFSFGQRHPVLGNFASSSLSVATGVVLVRWGALVVVVVTNWVDVIKVRQQLAGPAARNVLSTGAAIVWHEGPLALARGMTAAVARGVLYGGMRIGLYSPLKTVLGAGGKDPSIVRKIAAGMASDLVKTRMQIKGAAVRNPFAIAAAVVREEGAAGLWKGTMPSMARAALLTAAQCATYDEVKASIRMNSNDVCIEAIHSEGGGGPATDGGPRAPLAALLCGCAAMPVCLSVERAPRVCAAQIFFLRRYGWEDSFPTHLTVSGIAGVVTATAVAPADMVKTAMFAPGNSYRGPLDCAADIWRRLGPRGFFRGWGAQWARQGPMTSIIFIRMQLGMDTAALGLRLLGVAGAVALIHLIRRWRKWQQQSQDQKEDVEEEGKPLLRTQHEAGEAAPAPAAAPATEPAGVALEQGDAEAAAARAAAGKSIEAGAARRETQEGREVDIGESRGEVGESAERGRSREEAGAAAAAAAAIVAATAGTAAGGVAATTAAAAAAKGEATAEAGAAPGPSAGRGGGEAGIGQHERAPLAPARHPAELEDQAQGQQQQEAAAAAAAPAAGATAAHGAWPLSAADQELLAELDDLPPELPSPVVGWLRASQDAGPPPPEAAPAGAAPGAAPGPAPGEAGGPGIPLFSSFGISPIKLAPPGAGAAADEARGGGGGSFGGFGAPRGGGGGGSPPSPSFSPAASAEGEPDFSVSRSPPSSAGKRHRRKRSLLSDSLGSEKELAAKAAALEREAGEAVPQQQRGWPAGGLQVEVPGGGGGGGEGLPSPPPPGGASPAARREVAAGGWPGAGAAPWAPPPPPTAAVLLQPQPQHKSPFGGTARQAAQAAAAAAAGAAWDQSFASLQGGGGGGGAFGAVASLDSAWGLGLGHTVVADRMTSSSSDRRLPRVMEEVDSVRSSLDVPLAIKLDVVAGPCADRHVVAGEDEGALELGSYTKIKVSTFPRDLLDPLAQRHGSLPVGSMPRSLTMPKHRIPSFTLLPSPKARARGARGCWVWVCEDVACAECPLHGAEAALGGAPAALFCVFDGHCGRAAADAASAALPDEVADRLGGARDDMAAGRGAAGLLRDAFLATDDRIAAEEGCTATALLLWRGAGGEVCVQAANVGDSAALLIDPSAAAAAEAAAALAPEATLAPGALDALGLGPGPLARAAAGAPPPPPPLAPGVRALTEDHRLTNPRERARLAGLGIQLGDGARRLYGLNLSRGLGDKFLKDEDLGLSAEPHVSGVVRIREDQGCILLIASDGLWDVADAERAAAAVLQADREHDGDVTEAARAVVELALRQRSKDDVTALVVRVWPAREWELRSPGANLDDGQAASFVS
eukprot:scaffold12.g8144.t1